MRRADKWMWVVSGALAGGIMTHYLPPHGGWFAWLTHWACLGLGTWIAVALDDRKEKKP